MTVPPPSRGPVSLRDRCRPIRLLVLDVDGVLTAGGIVLGPEPLEVKEFHVRDGSALALWHRAGNSSALITGRTSAAVERRAGELGVTQVVQGAARKRAALEQLLNQLAVSAGEACYVGDDLPDLAAMQLAGLAAAVADASPDVRAAAHYVTRTPGGRGAVREVVELVLRCQGRWLEVAGEL